FIDMESARNQRDVENRLRDALKYDRARVQTGKISRFGLLELSRQRLQTSLGETSHIACPRCHGTGHIRSIESSALHILRILQEEAMKENTAALHAQVPVDVATYLLNEKRNEFHSIETRLKVNVLLIPNVNLQTPNYSVSRLRHDELNQSEVVQPSYRMAEVATEVAAPAASVPKPEPQRPQAAVQGITPAQPAPMRREEPKASILEKIFGWLTRKPEAKPEPTKARPRDQQQRRDHMRDGRGRGRGRPDEKRDERPPRPMGESRRDQNRPRGQEQAAGRPQDRQHRQPQRPARPEQGLAAVEQRQPGERPEGPREGEGRGRRRRGRRERQAEFQDNVREQSRGDQSANAAATAETARPPRERERPAPAASTPEVQTAVLEPVMFTREPVLAEPSPTMAPARQPQEPYLPEADTDRRRAETVVAAPARQPWKMEPIALPPDMVMIETQSEKMARTLEQERQDLPRPARPPRQQNAEPVNAEEPLQQVETRKD
ncbi:MAG: ribonuclease E/G, partial [Betaproteobacteria bacterium]